MDNITKEIQEILEADTEKLLKMADDLEEVPNPLTSRIGTQPQPLFRGLIHNLNQRP